jgi:hypothetical protein
MENTQKVFNPVWRIRGKYLHVHEEYDEVRGFCGIKNRRRIRGKYLNLFGEYAESILAHMDKTPKESCRILLIRQESYN